MRNLSIGLIAFAAAFAAMAFAFHFVTASAHSIEPPNAAVPLPKAQADEPVW
jgi:hypothetical protein